MRTFTVIVSCALFLLIYAGAAKAAEGRFVKVHKPFANIYEYLDPKSNIMKHAKKGDYFELIYEGTSWYQVKIQDKVGWLEKRAGSIVESHGATVMSVPIGTFVLFILLLLGTFAGASLFIYRQKTAEL